MTDERSPSKPGPKPGPARPTRREERQMASASRRRSKAQIAAITALAIGNILRRAGIETVPQATISRRGVQVDGFDADSGRIEVGLAWSRSGRMVSAVRRAFAPHPEWTLTPVRVGGMTIIYATRNMPPATAGGRPNDGAGS